MNLQGFWCFDTHSMITNRVLVILTDRTSPSFYSYILSDLMWILKNPVCLCHSHYPISPLSEWNHLENCSPFSFYFQILSCPCILFCLPTSCHNPFSRLTWVSWPLLLVSLLPPVHLQFITSSTGWAHQKSTPHQIQLFCIIPQEQVSRLNQGDVIYY